nr:uncharacterized protein LOC129388008 [Dermacentor andersoni]
MLHIQHQILAGKSRHTKAILDLDLECAFDIISHSTILERIYLLPPILRERTYNYLRDFLSNRKAFLSVRDISSEQLSLGRTGTPQGIANSEGACGPNNVLTVSDQGKDDLTSFGLAHEISHAIGAVHDGEGTADSCFDVGYVMSPYMIPSANPSYSPCSIADIEKFLGQTDNARSFATLAASLLFACQNEMVNPATSLMHLRCATKEIAYKLINNCCVYGGGIFTVVSS